jgi:hypothetical protein
MTQGHAPNTLKAYATCWKMSCAWYAERGDSPLPAHAKTVEDYLNWGATLRTPPYKLESLQLALNAFAQIDKCMDDFGKRMDRIDGRLDHIEGTLAGYVLDVGAIKGKLGM